MFCKIFFSYENNYDAIDNFEGIDEPYQIITTNEILNFSLKKRGKDSWTLFQKFPEIHNLTYEANRKASSVLNEYKQLLGNITFNGFEIFSGIENQLRDEMTFLEKIRMILDERKSVFFIFDRFSFTYFTILEMAAAYGYETNGLKVGLLEDNRITYVQPEDDHSKLDYKNKITVVKAMFSRLPDKNTLSISKKFFSLKLKRNIGREKILQSVNKKIQKTNVGYSAKIAFFFTSNIDDFLRAFYPILDILDNNATPFHVFTIDLITSAILTVRKIPFVDLFDQIYQMADFIRKSEDGQQLFNQIRLIATDNNLSLLYLKRFSDFFEGEIYRVAAIITICDYIIKQMNLKSVGICIDGSMYANSVITVTKKYNIPSISIEPRILNEKLERLDLYKADKICIYGSQGAEVLQKIGYQKERVAITGNPRHDHIREIDPAQSKKIVANKFGVDPTKKSIVIAMGRWHHDDEIWMSNLIKFCNQKNFEIIIKVHPIYKTRMNSENTIKLEHISNECKNLRYTVTADMDTFTLISAADLLITDYSNVGVEAILLKKPILTVNFTKEDLSNVELHKNMSSIYLEDYKKIEEVVLKILEDESAFISHDQEEAIFRYNFLNDGKAASRVIDLLLQKES